MARNFPFLECAGFIFLEEQACELLVTAGAVQPASMRKMRARIPFGEFRWVLGIKLERREGRSIILGLGMGENQEWGRGETSLPGLLANCRGFPIIENKSKLSPCSNLSPSLLKKNRGPQTRWDFGIAGAVRPARTRKWNRHTIFLIISSIMMSILNLFKDGLFFFNVNNIFLWRYFFSALFLQFKIYIVIRMKVQVSFCCTLSYIFYTWSWKLLFQNICSYCPI